jgi:hypothetical protein
MEDDLGPVQVYGQQVDAEPRLQVQSHSRLYVVCALGDCLEGR